MENISPSNPIQQAFLTTKDMLSLACLIGFYLLFRIFLARHFAFFDPDEALEMLVAQTLMHGEIPFVDAYSHRGPMLTLVYAAGLMIGGEFSFAGIQLIALAMFSFTLTILYGAVRNSFGSPAAFYSAALVVLLATLAFPRADIWALNSDYLLALWTTLGMSVLLIGAADPLPRATSPLCFFGGFLLAVGFLTKQNGIFFAFAPLVVFMSQGLRKFLILSTIYGAGFLVPTLLCLGFFLFIGEWERFWFLFYEYNSNYATLSVANSLSDRIALFSWALEKQWLLFLAPLVLLILWLAGRRTDIKLGLPALLILAWAAAGLISAAAPGRAWENYLWATIFPFSVAAGTSLALLTRICQRMLDPVGKRKTAIAAILLAGYAMCFVPTIVSAIPYLQMVRLQKGDRVGGITRPRNISRRELIEVIRTNSIPDDYIYISGYAPEIYILAKRRAASRHAVSNFVENFYPGSDLPSRLDPVLTKELLADLDRNRPRLIIDGAVLGFFAPPDSALGPVLMQYAQDNHYITLQEGVYRSD